MGSTRQPRYLALGEAGTPSVHASRHQGMLAHYEVRWRAVGVVGRARLWAPLPFSVLKERGQRRCHGGPHGRDGLPSTPAGPTSSWAPRRPQHDHPGRRGPGSCVIGRHDLEGRKCCLTSMNGARSSSVRHSRLGAWGDDVAMLISNTCAARRPSPYLYDGDRLELLARGRPTPSSFSRQERRRAGRLVETLLDLQPLRPSFVSVTYRAGPSSRQRTTTRVLHAAPDGAQPDGPSDLHRPQPLELPTSW